MILREYQRRTIDQLYAWFSAGNAGNPCIVMPTGSGKSHIVAELCKDALQKWPETRIVMLTHVKELIEQNAEKMRQHWPSAPLGIYSAGMGKRQLGEPITFAGIQSVRDRAAELGFVDLVIIDECHLVSHKNQGGYRELLGQLLLINPNLRVIGLTATPFRLGHGLITDKPAIFNALIEPIKIEELIFKGFLATLRSKGTKTKLDVTGVHKRGGDYIESELQAAVNIPKMTREIVREIIDIADNRKAWLLFCTGVDHAQGVCNELNDQGIDAACILGTTPKKERERILTAFKSGVLRAITNANVLTTGFDYPDIDLIAMLRPTMSAGLYVQMAGRGMRIKSHIDHCLVLDFAGVVETHGPITAVHPPKKAREGNGEVPVKECPHCHELCAIAARVCPACGEPFPEPEGVKLKLRHNDIMGRSGNEMEVTSWSWQKHVSRTSGKTMLLCKYYGLLSDPAVVEYFPILHEGYAGEKARRTLECMSRFCSEDFSHGRSWFDKKGRWASGNMIAITDLNAIVSLMQKSQKPLKIKYTKDGKFYRIVNRSWR